MARLARNSGSAFSDAWPVLLSHPAVAESSSRAQAKRLDARIMFQRENAAAGGVDSVKWFTSPRCKKGILCCRCRRAGPATRWRVDQGDQRARVPAVFAT
jgi:hypothetical protein